MKKSIVAVLGIAAALLTALSLAPSSGPSTSACPMTLEVKGIPPAPPKKYPEQKPTLGAIAGQVFFVGEPPTLPPLPPVPAKDHRFCGTQAENEALLVSPKGEVRNVVIAVRGYKPETKPEPREERIDNKNCYFVPHVLATTINSPIAITNSDATLHNARGQLRGWRRPFNSAIPAGGKYMAKASAKPGWGLLKCDMHPWMTGHVQVFDHELFDVTGSEGKYRLVNVPPGEYELEVWHERLAPGLKRMALTAAGKVKVEAGKTVELNLEVELDKDDVKKRSWRVRK